MHHSYSILLGILYIPMGTNQIIYNIQHTPIHQLRKCFVFSYTTSEYEPAPPVHDSLIKQQTFQSCRVLGEDGAYVRNRHAAASAAAALLHEQI